LQLIKGGLDEFIPLTRGIQGVEEMTPFVGQGLRKADTWSVLL